MQQSQRPGAVHARMGAPVVAETFLAVTVEEGERKLCALLVDKRLEVPGEVAEILGEPLADRRRDFGFFEILLGLGGHGIDISLGHAAVRAQLLARVRNSGQALAGVLLQRLELRTVAKQGAVAQLAEEGGRLADGDQQVVVAHAETYGKGELLELLQQVVELSLLILELLEGNLVPGDERAVQRDREHRRAGALLVALGDRWRNLLEKLGEK